MEYLNNPFNLAVNSSAIMPDAISAACIYLFYLTILESTRYINQVNNFYNNVAKYNLEEFAYDNIFEDNDNYQSAECEPIDNETIDNETKKKLIGLLDINSLDRHYILYYIFKMEGKTDKIANTLTQYRMVSKLWKSIDVLDENVINLDETLESNMQIVIDNDIIDCNIAHIRFLSWIYNSGIYNYLIDNNELKMQVLSEMNSNGYLKGNLFLKYQLYLVSMETIYSIQEEEQNNNQDILSKENIYDIAIESVITDATAVIDDEDITGDANTDDANTDDANIDDANTSEEEESHGEDNENELESREITEDLSDMNEATFAFKLLKMAKNITTRAIVNVYQIVKEEIQNFNLA